MIRVEGKLLGVKRLDARRRRRLNSSNKAARARDLICEKLADMRGWVSEIH